MAVASADVGYGSDKNGLIWGYLLAPEQPPREIGCEDAVRWLANPEAQGSSEFVWLHFSLSNAGAERWMRQSLQLTDAFYDSLRESVGSTRLELENDVLVAVMHDVLFKSTFDASSISTVTLCMNRRLVVSARLRPLRSIDRLRSAVKTGQSFRSSAELLAELLRDQAAVLAEIVRQSTERADAVEDTLLQDRVSISRNELSLLRRSLVRLQRLLAPEPAALFRLLSRPPSWLSEIDLQDLREATEEFAAAVVDSGALSERLKLLQEELAAMVSEHTSRTLFILTLVTVLALPINIVAGLLGMNVGGIPLSQHPQGFLLIVLTLSITTGLLAYYLLLKRRN